MNTIVGVSIILALDVGVGLPPAIANAIGYAVGICVGWLLQRRYVFRSQHVDWAMRARYIAVVLMAFGLNQLVLWVGHSTLGDAPNARILAQFLAIGTYTTAQFILLKLWVFRPARVP